jgi:hypothetical protein
MLGLCRAPNRFPFEQNSFPEIQPQKTRFSTGSTNLWVPCTYWTLGEWDVMSHDTCGFGNWIWDDVKMWGTIGKPQQDALLSVPSYRDTIWKAKAFHQWCDKKDLKSQHCAIGGVPWFCSENPWPEIIPCQGLVFPVTAGVYEVAKWRKPECFSLEMIKIKRLTSEL